MRHRLPPIAAIVASLLAVVTAQVRAQCQPQWLPGRGFPGVGGFVDAMAIWSPDEHPRIVFGGRMGSAGPSAAMGIATYDGTSWQALGAGLNAEVNSVLPAQDGSLVAAANYWYSSSTTDQRYWVTRWDGSSWSQLGGQFNARICALAQLPTGEIVAGGAFTSVGGNSAQRIARWDGQSWLPLGSGFDGVVRCLVTTSIGQLVAGGSFMNSGSEPAAGIAAWDGSAWRPVGGGVGGSSGSDAGVHRIATFPNDDLLVTGRFTTAGGAPAASVARWDGTAWTRLGTPPPPNTPIQAAAILLNGDPVIGVTASTSSAEGAGYIARWDGAQWQVFGSGLNSLFYSMLTLPSGDLLVGGQFDNGAGTSAYGVVKWNGTSWSELTHGQFGLVFALRPLGNGDLAVGGDFQVSDAADSPNVAMIRNGAWHGLGSGLGYGTVYALAAAADGSLIAGGSGFSISAPPFPKLVRWDGNSWNPISAELDGVIYALATMPNGDIVAGGTFVHAGSSTVNYIARWDGTSWHPMAGGMGPLYGYVQALIVGPSGDLFAAGNFTSAGGVNAGRIARWDGNSWHTVTPSNWRWGSGSIYALAFAPGGDLLAGGDFASSNTASANLIARWDGAQWHSLGPGLTGTSPFAYVAAITVPASGDVFAAGYFNNSGGTPLSNFARFDGASWHPLGNDFRNDDEQAWALAALPNGNVVAGISSLSAAGRFLSCVAEYGCQPCYPNCDGSTIPPLLTAADFQCFLNQFSASLSAPHEQQVACYANCDQSTTDPVLNINDFMCFLNRAAQGCP